MSKKTKTLTPIEYSARYSIEHIRAMCEKAGTTYDYWRRIRDRRQRPSVDLAMSLVAASGGELFLTDLLFKSEDRRGVGAAPVRDHGNSGKTRSPAEVSP